MSNKVPLGENSKSFKILHETVRIIFYSFTSALKAISLSLFYMASSAIHYIICNFFRFIESKYPDIRLLNIFLDYQIFSWLLISSSVRLLLYYSFNLIPIDMWNIPLFRNNNFLFFKLLFWYNWLCLLTIKRLDFPSFVSIPISSARVISFLVF